MYYKLYMNIQIIIFIYLLYKYYISVNLHLLISVLKNKTRYMCNTYTCLFIIKPCKKRAQLFLVSLSKDALNYWNRSIESRGNQLQKLIYEGYKDTL